MTIKHEISTYLSLVRSSDRKRFLPRQNFLDSMFRKRFQRVLVHFSHIRITRVDIRFLDTIKKQRNHRSAKRFVIKGRNGARRKKLHVQRKKETQQRWHTHIEGV
jgi:hypothetical protein